MKNKILYTDYFQNILQRGKDLFVRDKSVWIIFVSGETFARIPKRARSIYVHFDNEEGATDQFNRLDCCVTATTSGYERVQWHSKPRDTGAPAPVSCRWLRLFVRLFAQCRAICTHTRVSWASEKCRWKYFVRYRSLLSIYVAEI